MTRIILAFLLLVSATGGDDTPLPRIVGPQTVNVGNPPWLELTVADVPPGAVLTWTGPIGSGKAGFYTRDGVGLATVAAGEYHFRCRVQVPKDGLDPVTDLETVVTIVGTSPQPPTPPNPVPPTPDPPQPDNPLPVTRYNVANKLYAAAKAVNSPTRAMECRTLSGEFALAVAESTAQAIVDRPSNATRDTFTPAQKAAWKSWVDVWLSELKRLQNAGTVASLNEYRELALEVSQALYEASK